MPRRDEAYMADQRELIARAAREVLLEKGVYGTSLRDICRAADISGGALYIHYKTREDVIVAACMLDHQTLVPGSLPDTWAGYLGFLYRGDSLRTDERLKRRFRLSLQFVAETILLEQKPEGLSRIYLLLHEQLAAALKILASREIVALPLGVTGTARAHLMLMEGAMYQLASDFDLPSDELSATLHQALALTAGLKRPA